jgi:hypothetical protein
LFSAERQTAALVCALEGTPAAEPFVPGKAGVPPSLQSELDGRVSRDALGSGYRADVQPVATGGQKRGAAGWRSVSREQPPV